MQMTRFLLIRHAVTDAVGHTLSGRNTGVPLNREGIAQAQSLARRLGHLPINAVYSSPLERALATAQPIADANGLDVTIMSEFEELHFGQWTGRSFSDLSPEAGFKLFNSFRSSFRIPGGETMLEAQARFLSGMEKLRMRHPEGTIAVVSHSDMIKAAIAHFAGMHLDLMQRIEVSPAAVSIIELYPETARIMLLNHTGDVFF